MTEFALIARWFAEPAARMQRREGIGLGIGDDCALLVPGAGCEIAVSTDMLVAGRHFFDDVDPESLGWKTLAVNLSDLAAMGARPRAFTLALALPAVDEAWLSAFSEGLFACATAYDCALIGGDTTRGPLTLCVTVFGEVAMGRALRRGAAVAGDDVWVSGSLGGAALALQRLGASASGVIDPALRAALDRPTPRVALGEALVGVAHAAIDVSDGLAQDLGHVLAASGCGATLWLDALPCARELASESGETRSRFALAGGDDYELCFTAPVARRADVERAGMDSATRVTHIGSIVDGHGVCVVDADSRSVALPPGFDHFR
jgi:thiamine-monophosphate kinase